MDSPVGFDGVADDLFGEESGVLCGVAPVEGGSWSLRRTLVSCSSLVRDFLKADLSIAQLLGQLRASKELDLARARSSLEEVSRRTSCGRKFLLTM